jgi:hypothetical protein
VPHALLSDIHGNMRAFDAVLGELARFGIDSGLVLGDVAQGGEEPAAVLDRLAELGWPVILGYAGHFLLEVPHEHKRRDRRGAARTPCWSVGHPIYRWNDRRPLEHAEYAIVDGPSVEFRRCVY